MTQEKV